jgi:hypothetical protein
MRCEAASARLQDQVLILALPSTGVQAGGHERHSSTIWLQRLESAYLLTSGRHGPNSNDHALTVLAGHTQVGPIVCTVVCAQSKQVTW